MLHNVNSILENKTISLYSGHNKCWWEKEKYIVEIGYPSHEKNHEQYLQVALDTKPSIPCGVVDLGEIAKILDTFEPTEPGYAWERLPGWLARIEQVFQDIGNAPIIALDIGSSVPIYVEMLRSLEFSRDRRRASGVVSGLFNEASFSKLRERKGYLKKLHTAVARDSAARELLETVVAECLYQITPREAQTGFSENEKSLLPFMESVIRKMTKVDYIYYEDESGTIESSWGLQISKDQKDITYIDRLSQLELPTYEAFSAGVKLSQHFNSNDKTKFNTEELKELKEAAQEKASSNEGIITEYILWQVDQLARKIVGNRRYKPARFFSSDSADPKVTAASSLKHTPRPTQELHIFSRAIDSLVRSKCHLSHNIFDEPPFPDNSLALITCFDAWPLHFQKDPSRHTKDQDFQTITVDVLEGLYKKLAPGGKIVIFPWRTSRKLYQDEKDDRKILNSVKIELARRVGHGIDESTLHIQTLREEMMSQSDIHTSELLSPVINKRYEDVSALVITKPKESSLKTRRNHRQKRGLPLES